jgi:hypothetical protein
MAPSQVLTSTRMASTSPKKSNKVFVTLPQGARNLFNKLVDSKFYGSTSSEVARYLITSKLDDLIKEGRLAPDEAPKL